MDSWDMNNFKFFIKIQKQFLIPAISENKKERVFLPFVKY